MDLLRMMVQFQLKWKAFDAWVRRGRKDPVLCVFLPSLQSMCTDTCRNVGVGIPDVLNL